MVKRSRSKSVPSRSKKGRVIYKSVTRARNMRPRFKGRVNANTVYRYTRFASDPETREVTGTELAIGENFMLSDVKSYTDFTALYDNFKIGGVLCTFQLITNPSSFLSVNGAVNAQQQTNWYPKLWWVTDNDDDSAVSLTNIRERQGVKCASLRPDRPIKIFVKPSVAVQTYKTVTTTGYAPKRMFLDVATGASVPHYGLKTVIDTMGIDPVDKFVVRVEYKFYLAFRGVL